jgi:hypothetical protein
VVSPVASYCPSNESIYCELRWADPSTGTVTSVGLSMPSQFGVTNSPVTGTGTLTVAWNTVTANYGLFGPTSGGAAVPTFRALVSDDIPALATSKITSGTFAGSIIGSGTVPAAYLGLATGDAGSGGTSGAVPAPATGDATKFLTGAMTYVAAPGTGTVTNIATTAPITGGPITVTGTIGISDCVASGGSHARGAVPDPGASAGTTKFLREDCTFAVPAGSGVSVTTKGDLQTYDTGPARLPVGANGKVLVADSTATPGLSYWGGWVQISKITTAASQATVDFTSIPANYTDLIVIYQARSNVSGNGEGMYCKFNNDGTSGNYATGEALQGNATTASAFTLPPTAAGVYTATLGGTNVTANYASSGQILVANYLGTTFYKDLVSSFGLWYGSTSAYRTFYMGTWKSTVAITRLTFSVPTSFLNGSVFTLYGVGTP